MFLMVCVRVCEWIGRVRERKVKKKKKRERERDREREIETQDFNETLTGMVYDGREV